MGASASPATLPVSLRVDSSRRETDDTWTLALDAGPDGFPFRPGQFTMLYEFGTGEVPISVSGDPARPESLVHTVRAVGAVTSSICAVREGDSLGVRGPFGRGWPVDDAVGQDLVLVAGGLGLAPLRPALYAALGARERFRRLVLLYGGRDPASLLFRAELDRWHQADEVECMTTVDVAGKDWRGRVGVVPALVERADLDPSRTIALACGPEVMMRFTVDALLDGGVDPTRIYVSLERNMRCAVGHCGHCQLGGTFVCRDGPVFSWQEIEPFLAVREL
jgi:NAD(P)H-flavin reductase